MRLMPFQEIGRDFLLSRERCLLADEMGTGKGCQSITAAEKIGGNVLLITKASLTLNIEHEIKKWLPDAQVIQLRDEKSEVKLVGDVRFVVVSYNYLQQDQNVARLCKVKWSVIIADEFHKCKNPKTKTTKGFKKVIKGHKGKIWLMTGSPATNTGADYYMFLETCLPGKWGTYSEFRELFCNKEIDYWSGAAKYTGVRDGKKAILRQAFKKITLRRRLAEVVKELPEKIVQTLVVDVGEKKLPDSFSYEEIVEMMNKGKVPAKMAGEMQRVGLKKIEPAIDYIQECSEPIVVFFAHRAVLAGVKNGLKDKKVVTITGADSREEKNQAEQDFQNGKADVILLNLQAGSEGYTLTAARHMLFVEYPWSPAVLDQAMARIIRIGQQASCVHITKMVAENSYDAKVLKALESKSEFMAAVMNDSIWKR